jgi:hypothetical protein
MEVSGQPFDYLTSQAGARSMPTDTRYLNTDVRRFPSACTGGSPAPARRLSDIPNGLWQIAARSTLGFLANCILGLILDRAGLVTSGGFTAGMDGIAVGLPNRPVDLRLMINHLQGSEVIAERTLTESIPTGRRLSLLQGMWTDSTCRSRNYRDSRARSGPPPSWSGMRDGVKATFRGPERVTSESDGRGQRAGQGSFDGDAIAKRVGGGKNGN